MDTQIIYSLFADTIAKQLKRKKINFVKEEVKIIQELSFYTMHLKFHEIISEAQAEKQHAEIHKILLKHLDEWNAAEADA